MHACRSVTCVPRVPHLPTLVLPQLKHLSSKHSGNHCGTHAACNCVKRSVRLSLLVSIRRSTSCVLNSVRVIAQCFYQISVSCVACILFLCVLDPPYNPARLAHKQVSGTQMLCRLCTENGPIHNMVSVHAPCYAKPTTPSCL